MEAESTNAFHSTNLFLFSEGLTLENVSFQSLYGGQSTLSTQLINPNFVFHVPTDAAPQYL